MSKRTKRVLESLLSLVVTAAIFGALIAVNRMGGCGETARNTASAKGPRLPATGPSVHDAIRGMDGDPGDSINLEYESGE